MISTLVVEDEVEAVKGGVLSLAEDIPCSCCSLSRVTAEKKSDQFESKGEAGLARSLSAGPSSEFRGLGRGPTSFAFASPALAALLPNMAPSLHTAGASSSTPSEYKDAFELPIPTPSLQHSFRLACDLEPVRALGEGLHADGGQ